MPEVPMRGRKVVDICRVTRRKIPIQMRTGVFFPVSDWWSIFKRNPVPKERAMTQAVMTRKPKKGSESVDCEKTQRTGVKPRRRAPMSARLAARPCTISRICREVPVRAVKI